MTATAAKPGPTLGAHIAIARPDHWFKNVFVLPGVVLALAVEPSLWGSDLVVRFVLGMVSVCLVASSNYTINEVLDAPFDRLHPVKRERPVPSGRVHIGLAYLQWGLLMVAGVGLGWLVSPAFAVTMAALWGMGVLYNVRPIRLKDRAYVDVISEAVNNPLRMLAGWFIVGAATYPPASLLLSYWMVGCFFMALKRFAEYRAIGDPAQAAAYRRSFAYYTDVRLLVSAVFYSAAAMLFFGAFIMRYRIELVLSFPLVALVMSTYLSLAHRPDSPVQNPERLYREGKLMAVLLACTALMVGMLLIDIPVLYEWFAPLGPVKW
ncbi:MAG: decaprenyl-phosphate phosphoribosyltransferase [Myxococcota bacterium]